MCDPIKKNLAPYEQAKVLLRNNFLQRYSCNLNVYKVSDYRDTITLVLIDFVE